MIFSDKKLTSKSILVRFYEWSDKERGYGDAGTHCYKEIPLSKFEEKLKTRINKSVYYTYSINIEYGKKILNNNYWWCEYGYELSTEASRQNEIRQLRAQINKLKQ